MSKAKSDDCNATRDGLVAFPALVCPKGIPQDRWVRYERYRPDSLAPACFADVREAWVVIISPRLIEAGQAPVSEAVHPIAAKYLHQLIHVDHYNVRTVDGLLDAIRIDGVYDRLINEAKAGIRDKGARDKRVRSLNSERTTIRRLAIAAFGRRDPATEGYVKAVADAPYSAEQIQTYLDAAARLRSQALRDTITAVICLGHGAGLKTDEFRRIRAHHVVRTGNGYALDIPGRNARVVPLPTRYARRLLKIAVDRHDKPLVGASSTNYLTNRLGEFNKTLVNIDRLDHVRLRDTWLTNQVIAAETVELLTRAGLKNFRALDRVLEHACAVTRRG